MPRGCPKHWQPRGRCPLPSNCCGVGAIGDHFDTARARDDLKRFHETGPDPTTRRLIAALQAAIHQSAVPPSTLLDIGGGIGAVHHELLGADVQEAVHLDVSPAFLEVATEETARRGHGDRVRFVRGDFVALAEGIEVADLVTLDRVICCYPEMEPLVRLSAAKAGRLYGAVYPRGEWWVRLATWFENGVRRLGGSPFRAFVHPPARIRAELEGAGLVPVEGHRTFAWEIVVYARQGG